MDGVNKTLYIPLRGKAVISKRGIILKDPTAEAIWENEGFKVRGKMKSKWLALNMAMRARVFDDWTDSILKQNKDALILHIGCGLDSRCLRVKEKYKNWIDGDFPDVIAVRKNYYEETNRYHMMELNAADTSFVDRLPDKSTVIVILEGISMYLTNEQVNNLFCALEKKYEKVHILMDVYTELGAKASKYKNPINEVGVTKVYGIENIQNVLNNTSIKCKAEHSFTPEYLLNELTGMEKKFFKLVFCKSMYGKIYRLYELKRD